MNGEFALDSGMATLLIGLKIMLPFSNHRTIHWGPYPVCCRGSRSCEAARISEPCGGKLAGESSLGRRNICDSSVRRLHGAPQPGVFVLGHLLMLLISAATNDQRITFLPPGKGSN